MWGGVEFYKDYLNMKEQIQNYVAPDLSEFDRMNQVYEKFFVETKPARACVQVAALPKGAKVEIDAIAHQ